MTVPAPEALSYEALRGIVEEFRQEHWPSGEVPVDIEYIADVRLGLDIVALPHLYSGYNIDGFLSADRSTIYIDRAVQEHDILYRYRFTLAHELAHYHLHGELFDAAEFDSIESWKEFLEDMPEESRGWYEWQGYAFAGLLLVPAEPLAERIEDATERARRESFKDLDLDIEAHRDIVAEWVGRRFDVSADVIVRRGDYDDHWER